MTDPDLVFDMDPQVVQRVEQWIIERFPDATLAKRGDGSRLTWSLEGSGTVIEGVVATESFLSLPAGEVDRHLEHARVVCDDRQGGEQRCHLLLAIDGARAVEAL